MLAGRAKLRRAAAAVANARVLQGQRRLAPNHEVTLKPADA
jgi:hypothetical protein